MIKRLSLTVACLVPLSSTAIAGWYQVENYDGERGKTPIHFSMQKYDFGSGITVEGSYYDDATNSPVALYGKASGTEIKLCEIADDDELDRIIVQGSTTPFETEACPISLTLNDERAKGTWQKDGTEHAVVLRKTARLDDTGEAKIEGNVTIPFWAQTATHMFRGVYTDSNSGICMEKLEIINKSNSEVDQQIEFGGDICNAGVVMTPIYMNVQTFVDDNVEVMSVNFLDNRGGFSEEYTYDTASGRFRKKE